MNRVWFYKGSRHRTLWRASRTCRSEAHCRKDNVEPRAPYRRRRRWHKDLLVDILGKRDLFSFPKSIYAVLDALNAAIGNRSDALIVDWLCRRWHHIKCGKSAQRCRWWAASLYFGHQ